MGEVILTDLQPDKFYEVQVRAKSADGDSVWGPRFVFQTGKDLVKPGAPTGLSAPPVGTSFMVSWTRPALNEDLTPFIDLKDYEVTVGTGVYATKFYVTEEKFELTLERNIAIFGAPTASVPISVVARDRAGNVSTAATTTATNPPPSAPTGVTAFAVQGGIVIKWDANTTDNDFAKFRVHVGSTSNFVVAPANMVWEGVATSWTFETLTIQPFWIEVRSVDVMNASAGTRIGPFTPIDPFYVDGTPPGAVTNFAITQNIFDVASNRVNVQLNWTASPATDLAGYQIAYSTSSGGVPSYVSVGPEVVQTVVTGLMPGAQYYFTIQAYDYDGNYSTSAPASNYPVITAADTTLPSDVSGLSVFGGATSITAYWSESEDIDVRRGRGWYEVQIDTVNTFNSANLKTTRTSAIIATFTGLITSTPITPVTYWVRVKAIDASGNAGAWCPAVSANTNTPGQFIPSNSVSGDIIAGATIAGGKVIAGSLNADRLEANTGIAQNLYVESTLILGPEGAAIVPTNAGVPEIRSSNYATDPNNGFRLTSTGLEIRSGTIEAKALRIQTASNIVPAPYAGFEMAPAWYTGKIASSATSPTVVSTRARFQTQSLQYTAANSGYFYFAPGATDTNIPVEAGKTYILSWYGQAVSGTVNVQPVLRNQATVDALGAVVAQAAGAWTRYSQVLTAPASSTNAAIFFYTSGGGQGAMDGVQLEEQISGATTPSAWNPSGLTSIDGDMIKTGSIASSTGAWSINLNGNATFSNAQITGILKVNNSTGYAIQSEFYTAGSQGWMIRGDGFAELNNVTIRGTLVGATGSFTGSLTIGTSAFNVDSSGNLWMGATTWANAVANNKFRVDTAGNLYGVQAANISGTITANALSTTYTSILSNGTITTGSYFSVNTAGQLTATAANLRGSLQIGDTAGNGISIYLNSNGIYYGNANSSSNFWVTPSGVLYANGAQINGSVIATGTIESATMTSGSFTTNVFSQPRAQLGAGIAADGYIGSSVPAVRFYNGSSGTHSGVAGTSTAAYMYSQDGSTRIHMDASAGTGGQINFYTNTAVRMTVTGASVAFNDLLDVTGVGASAGNISSGSGIGDKISLYASNYGIGIQSNRMVLYAPSGATINAMVTSGNAQRSSASTTAGNYIAMHASAFTVNSLRATKSEITDLKGTALNRVKALHPVRFKNANFKSHPTEQQYKFSFIAEEVAEVVPEAASYAIKDDRTIAKKYADLNSDSTRKIDKADMHLVGIDVSVLTTTAIAAIQELTDLVEDLRAEVDGLKSQLTENG